MATEPRFDAYLQLYARASDARYGYTARHLAEAGTFARRIEEFAGPPWHEDYLRRLRDGHGRKTAFCQAVADSATTT